MSERKYVSNESEGGKLSFIQSHGFKVMASDLQNDCYQLEKKTGAVVIKTYHIDANIAISLFFDYVLTTITG